MPSRLREGELLHLNQSLGQPLVVEVDEKPVYLCEPGRLHQKRAVKLIRRISEE